ncbi:MAG: hypothetical protein ABSH47_16940 [Bryobacteraceae bacterium]|jgi:hypothetical protein
MSGLRVLVVVAVALSLSPQAFARKAREWQTGTVLDPRHSPYFTASTNDAPYGGATDVPLMKVYEPFLLEGDTTAYFVREGLRWQRRKPANLKPGGPVKFAVEGQKMFVLDDDGREHRMEITKQVPRAAH